MSLFSTCKIYRADRNLLSGQNSLHFRQADRDLLHALSQRHDCDTAFDEPVCGTSESKLVTWRYPVNCQSQQNRPGMNHQPSDYWHVRASIGPFPRPDKVFFFCIIVCTFCIPLAEELPQCSSWYMFCIKPHAVLYIYHIASSRTPLKTRQIKPESTTKFKHHFKHSMAAINSLNKTGLPL